MFGFVRIILGLVMLTAVNIIIAKSQLAKKQRCYILSGMLVVILISVSAFFPLENAFITFSTPEAALNYYTWKPTSDVWVTAGENCDLVIANNEKTDTLLIIPKTNDGWKIGIGTDTRKVKQSITNEVIINIYRYKHTNDFFITVLDLAGKSIELEDACNSEFYNHTYKHNAQNKQLTVYSASIGEFNENYWVKINGGIIYMGQGKTGDGSLS